jgi:MinD superfamily P-loop ATPase
MKEITVISGKGGTGKTTIVASLAALANRPVLADCDVDAADLHLILSPRIRETFEFRSGHEAIIRPELCDCCDTCLALCRFGAIRREEPTPGEVSFSVDPAACEGCGVCVRFCPFRAIEFPVRDCGEWFVSKTRFGPMVHARLRPGAENSGKLVSVVRKNAKGIAANENKEMILVDGPPGIGCPVIASLTGVSHALIVTEPTRSGEHDLERVLSLASHFGVPAAVCVNRWDLNPEMTFQIEAKARSRGAEIVGRIRYDSSVTAAQVEGQAIVERSGSPAARDIQEIWKNLWRFVN